MDSFIRSFWRVVPDPEAYEFVQGPEYQWYKFQRDGYFSGDCDDAATLLACFASILGWPCSLIAIREKGNPEFCHVWLRVYLDNRQTFFDVDPIVPSERLPLTDDPSRYAELMEVPIIEHGGSL